MWSALESSRGLVSVAACWRARVGDDYDAFFAAFLSRNGQNAKFYPCPCHCGCMHEVVDCGDGNFVAACRCEEPHCPDIKATQADITLWELSWSKLSRGLCAAFGLNARPHDFGLLNTRQIGTWSASGVPVILTIQTEGAWFRGVVLELIGRLRGRFILLAPTSVHYDAFCREMLENAGAEFFTLEGNLRLLPSGLLQPMKMPGELFRRFNPQPGFDAGEQVASEALALIERLGEDRKGASTVSVFRLYCKEGLSAAQVARKLKCSKPTVLRRLRIIEQKTGMPASRLRMYSDQFERIAEQRRDSRSRTVWEDLT